MGMILNSCKHKRGPEKEQTKVKVMREIRNILFEGRNIMALLEGSQVSPARPSDEGSVEVSRLEWLEAVPSDTESEIWIF
jgi:hypothetical protein